MAKVLGKGLAALIRNNNSEQEDNNVPLKSIIPNPNQPRQNFSLEDMEALVKSISEKGIIQPLAVRKINNNQFELISGERRLRAATKLKLKTIPVHIINIKNNVDSMELALIENIQRVDLNAMEEAEAYFILMNKYKQTQTEISKKVSKSRSEIANKIRLLKLPKMIQESIKKKEIDYGHARALLSISDNKHLIKIYKSVLNKKLSVRQTEQLSKSLKKLSKNNQASLNKYTKQQLWLKEYLNTNIKIIAGQKNKIIIEFANDKKLDSIINKIINE